jgi:NTP pyrophosphatase (non-canonical NTP hydrolase)
MSTLPPNRFNRALADSYREIIAAEEQHGALPASMHQQLGILTEEVGELGQAVNHNLWVAPNHAAIRTEALQVAAVAIRIAERVERLAVPAGKAA